MPKGSLSSKLALMFYRAARVIMRIFLKFFFRKIYFNYHKPLDKNRSYLIACNHPSSFLEGLLLASFMDIPLYFMVRSDVFRWWSTPLLSATHQIPIARFRDGFSRLRENIEIFSVAAETLHQGHHILIFSEATTKMCSYVRPVQLGTAKLAQQTLKKFPDTPLRILPVGINYTAPLKFKSEALINFGKPFSPETDESRLSLERLTHRLEKEIRQLVEEDKALEGNYCADQLRSKLMASDTAPLPVFRKNLKIQNGDVSTSKLSQFPFLELPRNLHEYLLLPLALPGFVITLAFYLVADLPSHLLPLEFVMPTRITGYLFLFCGLLLFMFIFLLFRYNILFALAIIAIIIISKYLYHLYMQLRLSPC